MTDTDLSPGYYSPVAIDHFENPRNVGKIDGADVSGRVINPVCGDELQLFLNIEDSCNEQRISKVSFLASGCPATIATSSMATQLLINKSVSDALELSREDFAEAVGGLPSSKIHCSVLAEVALKQALDKWRAK